MATPVHEIAVPPDEQAESGALRSASVVPLDAAADALGALAIGRTKGNGPAGLPAVDQTLAPSAGASVLSGAEPPLPSVTPQSVPRV